MEFWANFVDTFDLTGYKVYIVGESYAGMYVPYIASGSKSILVFHACDTMCLHALVLVCHIKSRWKYGRIVKTHRNGLHQTS